MGGIPGLLGFLVAMSMRESVAWLRIKEKKERHPLLDPSFSGEEGLNLQRSTSGKTGLAGLFSRESLPTLFITTCLSITLQMTGKKIYLCLTPVIQTMYTSKSDLDNLFTRHQCHHPLRSCHFASFGN